MAKPYQSIDPQAAREAERYINPVASREFIVSTLRQQGGPCSFNGLAELLRMDADQQEGLQRRLKAMVREGQLLVNRRGGYLLVGDGELLRGRVTGHRDGFGFVQVESTQFRGDVFLPPSVMRKVMHADYVVVQLVGRNDRDQLEGRVIEILQRGTARLAGRISCGDEMAWVEPSSKRQVHAVTIPLDSLKGATDGDFVVVDIVHQPTLQHPPIGAVSQVLGASVNPDAVVAFAILAHAIPNQWPVQALQEAAAFGDEISAEAISDRWDLRGTPLVTIDGEDARDFDDAVFCEPKPYGWRLLVAIADVSHYVKPGSVLDQAAQLRGTSVYFPQQVIPMLPEALSNGLCSLNPGADRLCMVCEMQLGSDGVVRRSRFRPAVMRSWARLTYAEVAAALRLKKPEVSTALKPLMNHLHALRGAYQALLKARRARGALDFEFPEIRAVVADNQVVGIAKQTRTDAHRLIEECMIAANIAAAKTVTRARFSSLYRVHLAPSPSSLNELRTFLKLRGLRLPKDDDLQVLDLARLLKRASRRDDSYEIEMRVLRAMSQAVYSPNSAGHFALGLVNYAHFTSPIRRYPDLLVHRALKAITAGVKPEMYYLSREVVASLGVQCSAAERRADDATREANDWLKCHFMQQHVGGRFRGKVTGVQAFGLFVQLEDLFVDGLLHVTSLPRDYYHYDALLQSLVGERNGQRFTLGQELEVLVAAVRPAERKIDFELVGVESDQRRRATRFRRRVRR